VGCDYCGGGDRWIKTCRAAGGSRIRVCDSCYETRASELVIVPGDHVVTVRCDGCGIYGNPRDFVGVVPGGRAQPARRRASGMLGSSSQRKEARGEEDPRLRPPLPRLLVRGHRCRIRVYREKANRPWWSARSCRRIRTASPATHGAGSVVTIKEPLKETGDVRAACLLASRSSPMTILKAAIRKTTAPY
jgi:hypothetical protein